MKLPESTAFELFDKHGISHAKLNPTSGKVVVKADLPIGGKKKAGLVRVTEISHLSLVTREILEKSTKEFPFDSVIVEEFIEHDHEYFVALRAVREGIEVYYSGIGGIDVEENWERVEKILVPEEMLLQRDSGRGQNDGLLNEQLFFKLIAEKVVREWIVKLLQFFQEEDATYLEINPFTLVRAGIGQERASNKQVVMPLGVVLEVDEAASFRHSDWPELPDFSRRTDSEKRVVEVDSQIKGSIKLVEVPNISSQFTVHSSQQASGSTVNRELESTANLTAVMGGGAGSVLFLCDAVLENGLQLANYAEFSGNPPNWALTELTKEICKIPGIKNLVIGSGIANFTPAKANIEAIIEGLRASPPAKNLNIVVRRCGPGEEEGIALMKKFIRDSGWKHVQVFDRYTGMTEIVKKL